MKKLISGAIAAATLAGTAMTGTAANAQRWGGYHGGYGYGHRGYGTGALVGVGLLGLAAGVAIADRPRYYGGGYGPGYYRPALRLRLCARLRLRVWRMRHGLALRPLRRPPRAGPPLLVTGPV